MKRRKHYYRPRRPPGSVLPYTPPREPDPEPILGTSGGIPITESVIEKLVAQAEQGYDLKKLTNTVRMRDDEDMTTPKPSPPPAKPEPVKPEPAKREPFARRDVLNYILAYPNEDLTISDIVTGTGRLETSVVSVLARLRTDADAGTLGIDGTIQRVARGAYRYTPTPVTVTKLAEQYAPGAPPETPAASNGHAVAVGDPAPPLNAPAWAQPVPAPPSKRLWEEFGVTSRGVILAQDENGALWKVEEIDL